MNQIIQTQLDRIDASLSTLIESIASYNPSIPAAQDLLAADDELNKRVKQLVTHQRNHARITSLRSEIDTLNATITSKLTALATLRSDILAQKISPVSDEARQVPCGELLDYAQRISRYTVPPSYRPLAPQTLETKASEAGGETSKGEVNGVGAEQAGKANTGKEAEAQVPVMPAAGGFVPWPSEEVIRQGALGQVQILLEQGIDPTTVESEGLKQTEDLSQEAEQRKDDAAPQDGQRPQQDAPMSREVPREEKPKVFGGLDLYDPDEE